MLTEVSVQIGLKPVMLSEYTLGIQIGNVCCALKCPDIEIYHRLQRIYHDFLTTQPAGITCDLVHRNVNNISERHPYDSDLEFKYINRFLSFAYNSACKVKYAYNPPAMLVHACGILRSGKVIVFTGPREAGKTTTALLCGERHGKVINDEMLLFSRPTADNPDINIQGTPIIGGISTQRNITAPLSCILFLKKSNKTLVNRLNRVDAYLRFLYQVITPTYTGQREKRAALSLMAEFSDEVTGTIPVYELEFNLDGESLWRTVAELEGELDKKNRDDGKSCRPEKLDV
jgi:hypothetical protein